MQGRGKSLGLPLQLNSHPQALLSHRPREVTVSLRATGLVLKAIPPGDTEGEELGMQSWEMGGMRRKSGRKKETGSAARRQGSQGWRSGRWAGLQLGGAAAAEGVGELSHNFLRSKSSGWEELKPGYLE